MSDQPIEREVQEIRRRVERLEQALDLASRPDPAHDHAPAETEPPPSTPPRRQEHDRRPARVIQTPVKSAASRQYAVNDATPRSVQMSNQRKQSPEFSIWWPQTKQGLGIWLLILGASGLVGAIGGWNSAGRYDDEETAAFVGAITGAASWYLILVVVRYIAHWFTQQRRTAQPTSASPPATPQPTTPNPSSRRVAGKLCPECDTTNPDRVVWMDEKQMWCQDCGATWVPPRV